MSKKNYIKNIKTLQDLEWAVSQKKGREAILGLTLEERHELYQAIGRCNIYTADEMALFKKFLIYENYAEEIFDLLNNKLIEIRLSEGVNPETKSTFELLMSNNKRAKKDYAVLVKWLLEGETSKDTRELMQKVIEFCETDDLNVFEKGDANRLRKLLDKTRRQLENSEEFKKLKIGDVDTIYAFLDLSNAINMALSVAFNEKLDLHGDGFRNAKNEKIIHLLSYQNANYYPKPFVNEKTGMTPEEEYREFLKTKEAKVTYPATKFLKLHPEYADERIMSDLMVSITYLSAEKYYYRTDEALSEDECLSILCDRLRNHQISAVFVRNLLDVGDVEFHHAKAAHLYPLLAASRYNLLAISPTSHRNVLHQQDFKSVPEVFASLVASATFFDELKFECQSKDGNAWQIGDLYMICFTYDKLSGSENNSLTIKLKQLIKNETGKEAKDLSIEEMASFVAPEMIDALKAVYINSYIKNNIKEIVKSKDVHISEEAIKAVKEGHFNQAKREILGTYFKSENECLTTTSWIFFNESAAFEEEQKMESERKQYIDRGLQYALRKGVITDDEYYEKLHLLSEKSIVIKDFMNPNFPYCSKELIEVMKNGIADYQDRSRDIAL